MVTGSMLSYSGIAHTCFSHCTSWSLTSTSIPVSTVLALSLSLSLVLWYRDIVDGVLHRQHAFENTYQNPGLGSMMERMRLTRQ
jgi:membrane protein implicated in regulation of membrane protease activity